MTMMISPFDRVAEREAREIQKIPRDERRPYRRSKTSDDDGVSKSYPAPPLQLQIFVCVPTGPSAPQTPSFIQIIQTSWLP